MIHGRHVNYVAINPRGIPFLVTIILCKLLRTIYIHITGQVVVINASFYKYHFYINNHEMNTTSGFLESCSNLTEASLMMFL